MQFEVLFSRFACNCFELKCGCSPEELENEACRQGCPEDGSVLFHLYKRMSGEQHTAVADLFTGFCAACPQMSEMPKSQ